MSFVPRFSTGPHGPGDTVEGALVAQEPLGNLRSLNAYLRYVDSSPSFASSVTFDSAVPIHEGPVAQGQEIPFSFRMPEDALPNWEHPSTQEYGTLGWAIVMETDEAAGLDHVITRSIPVDRTGGTWTGPAPGEPRIDVMVDNWDVEIEPDRWVVRHGDQVTFTVRIGKPKAARAEKLLLYFCCQVAYDVEVKHMGTGGDTDYRRVTKHVNLFREDLPLDASLPEQQFTVTIPENLPFSYAGNAVGFNWFAQVGEKRRFYQSDASRTAYLQVLP